MTHGSIGRLVLRLPPGHEARAGRVGRQVAEHLASDLGGCSLELARLEVPVVTAGPHDTDALLARRIADGILAAVDRHARHPAREEGAT